MGVAITDRVMAVKRAKLSNRVTADPVNDVFTYQAADAVNDFLTFPVLDDHLRRPFRQEVLSFVSAHARLMFPSSSLFSNLTTWRILLRVGDPTELPDLSPVVVALNIVEEVVTRSHKSVYCHSCQVVGWSGHPVCRKRYHFIISSDSNKGHYGPCPKCRNFVQLSDSSCKWCDNPVNYTKDRIIPQFDDHTQLLHGVVHGNGYGHLLTVNGREGGSTFLSGQHIMDFWDRLCTRLAVRKVTVMDVSKKYGMDFRLLHAVSEGHSWYGNWGYKFKAGSYALTQVAYMDAVKTLSSTSISPLLFQKSKDRRQLQAIISLYQSLSHAELLTFKDLFSFLLRLIHERRRCSTCPSNVLCAWTNDDVEHVQQGMIKVLLAARNKTWIRRRALKGVMCKSASSQLLDYSLMHLKGKLTPDGMVVQYQYTPNSNDLEFRLVPLNILHPSTDMDANSPSEEHIINDLKFLYDSLLNPETVVSSAKKTLTELASKILDCKQFAKDYEQNQYDPFAIQLWCHVTSLDQNSNPPPSELLVFPVNATVADLKREASKAFEDVYVMYKKFQVEKLPEYGRVDNSLSLLLLVGSSGTIKVKGKCPLKQGLLRYRSERGMENWEVDCTCGAKDDDGERMLACDSCQVWQHSRCAGIKSSERIPANFVCVKCINIQNKISESDLHSSKVKYNGVTQSHSACRSEVVLNHTATVQVQQF